MSQPSSTISASEQCKRPGGRSALVRTQVLTALSQLVAEQGRDQVTVPAVAERAGVSASSIYRRWGDMSGLLVETATHRLDPDRPLVDTGDLRGDLLAWAHGIGRHLSQPTSRSLLKAAAGLAHSRETDCLRNRKAEANVLVERARARGEVTPEPEQIVDHVVAPIVFRLLFGTESVEPSLSARLVDELMSLHRAAPIPGAVTSR